MRILLASGLMLACGTASAATARCHVIYGGENWTVDATPTDKPYLVEGKKIGRYFEFKLAYVDLPATGTAIKIYTYSTVSGESVLIHQATHKPPFDSRNAPFGFTGFNYVYEPSKSSELQYWCEHQGLAPGSEPVREHPIPAGVQPGRTTDPAPPNPQ